VHTAINHYMYEVNPGLGEMYRIVVCVFTALNKVSHGHPSSFLARSLLAGPHFHFTLLLLSEIFVQKRVNSRFSSDAPLYGRHTN
jgi:hypothetical protein